MGNFHSRSTQYRNETKLVHSSRDGRVFTSQFSLSHFVGNLSGRSFASLTSSQSVYSASRPWSRISRRRWNDSTINNPLQASKTAWPVAHKESIFLPEFSIASDLIQKDFEIIENIAKGAFGEVIKVKKLSEKKEFALKVLNKSQIVNENAVRQVKEEARIHAAVGHHSFVGGSVSRWQTKKRLYILSEYIPGGELLALLDKYGKLPAELVKIFVAEISIAIDFLHNAGVIYRDLKPENILLDSNYHIQLVDFGLSKWLSIGGRTTTLCGTLKYMAPEVLEREPYGHAVDWWSLGVVACYMLTGEFPTPAVDISATLSSTAGSASSSKNTAGIDQNVFQPESQAFKPGALPDSASVLSKEARGLLMRLLEKDPKIRLRNLRQLQQSAFYMGFNFEHIKKRKVSPKNVLSHHFNDQGIVDTPRCTSSINQIDFKDFDQPATLL